MFGCDNDHLRFSAIVFGGKFWYGEQLVAALRRGYAHAIVLCNALSAICIALDANDGGGGYRGLLSLDSNKKIFKLFLRTHMPTRV